MSLKRTLLRYLPKDKVTLLKEAPPSTRKSAAGATAAAAAEEPEGPFAPLTQAGIHPARGLYYCQQDEALYRSLLAEFASGAKEKEERLQSSYQNKNWKDYALLTHSLKSTSGTIGATTLSENAAVLEAAANSEDTEKIQAEHENLLELYRRTTKAIRGFCEDEDLSPQNSSGILEFIPEE